MKVSELISELLVKSAGHGDIDVRYVDGDSWDLVEVVDLECTHDGTPYLLIY